MNEAGQETTAAQLVRVLEESRYKVSKGKAKTFYDSHNCHVMRCKREEIAEMKNRDNNFKDVVWTDETAKTSVTATTTE